MAPKDVPDNYIPAEDEPFMNDRQRAYFRKKLLSWKNDILREARETLDHMADRAFEGYDAGRPRCPFCGGPTVPGKRHVCARAN